MTAQQFGFDHGPHSVLVVDDDPGIRDLFAAVLADEGHAVNTAADGHRALELAERERPCLIVLDLMMPVMDGWEVAERLHADRELSKIPVVVVSAFFPETPDAAEFGAVACLPKPLEIDELLDVVEHHCSQAA
jgi:two-component system chemotaxis response regulator CheY